MDPYWARPPADIGRELSASLTGLTSAEARQRLARVGPNEIHRRKGASHLRVLWRQLRSPLVLLLVFAAGASIATGEWSDGAIVAAILVAGVGIGYRREYRAEVSIETLLERIQLAATVVRDGVPTSVPVREIVPGDVFLLVAGSIVPADGILLECDALHVDDAVLTGESFPAHKQVGTVDSGAGLRARTNCVQLGTNVRSGTAKVLAVTTGGATEIGAIADRLAAKAPETDLERGLRRFGMLLLGAMLVMIVVVFSVHVMLGNPAIDTLLFAIALAVGLSPELLPAILAVNLARATESLAAAGVLVRRLAAIENLGSMTVLCTDKTGTLTEGVVRVDGAYAVTGEPDAGVMELAALNAKLQAGLQNPIDAALLEGRAVDTSHVRKLGEVPYDFSRKRLSVVIERDGEILLVTKGAVAQVLAVCGPTDRAAVEARVGLWAAQGIRVIAVATKRIAEQAHYNASDEHGLELRGFLTFFDRPKADAAAAIAGLRELGVRIKMITGDSRAVALHVAEQVGIAKEDVYAEVDPSDKERILRALRKGGAVVGFFGDGVNDAPAMHAADVSLSVESAVDVAKATADMVLTKKSLAVVRDGVMQGRFTFANTLKYILTTTSANLGNMISMAVASLVLPFLPLTAGQVLLNNFLSDVPAVGIASDRVDPELLAAPRRWDIKFIGRFMLEFGLVSSLFDALTFVTLVVGFHADAQTFRTGWFVESLFTELAIALVVRTRRPAWKSQPGRMLLWSSIAVAVLALAIPYLPYTHLLGFVAVPASMTFVVIAITFGYVLASEAMKSWFYRHD